MYTYSPKTFSLPPIAGMSAKSIEEHIGLYQGYVKNFNAIQTLIVDLLSDSAKNAHAISELVRRRSFEFDGMRLHEIYFAQLEGEQSTLPADSSLSQKLIAQFGSLESAITQIKSVGLMRGPGWSILYFDSESGQFHIGFSGEQHQGHFATLPIILALDVWEHAYLLDHGAQGKAAYIESFFAALNWTTVDSRFTALTS